MEKLDLEPGLDLGARTERRLSAVRILDAHADPGAGAQPIGCRLNDQTMMRGQGEAVRRNTGGEP